MKFRITLNDAVMRCDGSIIGAGVLNGVWELYDDLSPAVFRHGLVFYFGTKSLCICFEREIPRFK